MKTYIRMILVFTLTLSLFLIDLARICVINTDEKILTATENNSYNVVLSSNRGRIFDCNLQPLTGSSYDNYAVITPSPRTITYVSGAFSGEEKISILGKLRNGKPAVVKMEESDCAGIINVQVPNFENTDFCAHLLGYTNSANVGVSGLQKAMDKYLYSSEKICVKYYSNAYGEVLSGIEPQVFGDTLSTTGVITTIDKNVQVVIENASKKLNRGAVVVSEIGTGKIRGMLSKPSFSADNLNEALNSKDSPLINRALMGYNVGSVFKPCVAVAGGVHNTVMDCTGSVGIDNSTFFCHKRSGHGVVNMKEAIVNSCNTYFYRYAINVGGDKLYETATLFGFGYSKKLCEGIATEGESLPEKSELKSNKNLANFAIGQGKLLASPVTLLCLYEAIANGGEYYTPILIEGIMKNAVITEKYSAKSPTKAMDKAKADLLKEYLKEVVKSGTGKGALSENVAVAGKTATAQTGWKDENGEYIEHSWFCGFFPADNPKYVAVVLLENVKNQDTSATEIFKNIAEDLTPNLS